MKRIQARTIVLNSESQRSQLVDEQFKKMRITLVSNLFGKKVASECEPYVSAITNDDGTEIEYRVDAMLFSMDEFRYLMAGLHQLKRLEGEKKTEFIESLINKLSE